MMPTYSIRPLTEEAKMRLGKRTSRSTSLFDSTWTSTEDLLLREVGQLRPRNNQFVLMCDDVTESDIRRDGRLRADASIGHDVAVAIDSWEKGDLLFTTGKFYGWQHNVRAIALCLEALRKVERYGIVQSDEQYRGWQALPPGTPMPAARMTIDEAMRLLRDESGVVAGADWEYMYRLAAKVNHPDVEGGDADMFRRITEARDLLRGMA